MADSNRNAELEQLLHAINHDLRTPLSNIRSVTTILLQDLNDSLSDEQRVFLDIIDRSVIRILDQSNRLSLFGQIAFGQSEIKSIQLSELLANTQKTLRSSYEIEGTQFITNSDPLVRCYPHTLAALLALLAAGDTKQQATPSDLPAPTIQVTADKNRIQFRITSQMPAHEFALGFTELASQIVNLHGGTLNNSAKDGRKQFSFTIPHTPTDA
ncbi:histidine kinase dimerization/phospho-acceptor domain-containing protein [Candidatus Leptofilum sp.]|uniref:histidine kinase dimerization/phospho-acceptor domain-containing protein n=1 Tax=Candidatus Leptofilum sp. TaxID=3241576 RepID=UPI003B593F15